MPDMQALQVGAADPARAHAHQQFAVPRHGARNAHRAQAVLAVVDLQRLHVGHAPSPQCVMNTGTVFDARMVRVMPAKMRSAARPRP